MAWAVLAPTMVVEAGRAGEPLKGSTEQRTCLEVRSTHRWRKPDSNPRSPPG
jgi:hypothetical protein